MSLFSMLFTTLISIYLHCYNRTAETEKVIKIRQVHLAHGSVLASGEGHPWQKAEGRRVCKQQQRWEMGPNSPFDQNPLLGLHCGTAY